MTFTGLSFAQETPLVDFTHLKAEISIFPSEAKLSGDVSYTFDVLQPTDSVIIDARKMEFQKISLNGEEVAYKNDEQHLLIFGKFEESNNNILKIKYTASPTQAMYFIQTDPEGEDYEVWTQGQGKYTSNWMPSFDDVNEKVEFDLSVLYEKGKKVIANGRLIDTVLVGDNLIRWDFDMKNPMSSYLLGIATGDYDVKEITSETGVFMQLYYPVGQEHIAEPTYRHSARIMNFLEKEIGVPYPWQNYKQVPVRDFLYAGMENTGLTIYSDLFLVDSIGYNDRNYIMVNSHELAHQWFGNLVTATSGKHHWLQEGFATYYSLLAEQQIFGDDYFYWKLFQTADDLKNMSDSGKGEALLKVKASSLTYYQKGAWALHILKGLVGKEAFDLAVKNYLLKHAFQNVTTNDFMVEVEAASGKDLSEFKRNWLEQSAFQGTEALESLKKSPFIKKYLEIAALKQLPIQDKKELLFKALEFPVNNYVGQEAVYQIALEETSSVIDLYKKAFDTNNLYVRQAIAISLKQIPQELKQDYETLLEDHSYVTQEAALFNLWANFPRERQKYLQKMAGENGFLDKNIRTLWLALAVATPQTGKVNRGTYLEELSSYTAPHHRFQTRQNAFNYLMQLNAFQSKNIYDLLQASRHHNYRFRVYSKNLLKQVLKSKNLLPEDRSFLEEELGLKNSQN